jgi:hypothetical protein
MPTSVRQLFNKFGIIDFQQVRWGTIFSEKRQGIYVVSTSNNPDKYLGITDQPNFDNQQINLWISKLPDFQIDGLPATLTNIKNRLAEFWFPDESILYIGKAPTRKSKSGISKRVSEYFSTIIGNRGPHSGGQWIKTLKDIDTFTVYYSICDKPEDIEHRMLDFFMINVSKTTLLNLYDKKLPIPFANIKFTGNKNHGLKSQRLRRLKNKTTNENANT